MNEDEQTVASRLLDGVKRPLIQSVILSLVVYIISFIIVLFPVIPTPSQLLDSTVSTLSPNYSHETRLQISLNLMQVAVLYFAVLVAVLRFVDTSSRFSAEEDRPLFMMVLLSVLLVSVSAFSSVVSSLRLLTETAFVVSLLSMGVAFLFSFLTPVLAVVSESRGAEQEETDDEAQPRQSQRTEDDGNSDCEKVEIAHERRWEHCMESKQQPKE